MWFKTLWHQPNSAIREVLAEYLDPDNPPIWLQRAWAEFSHCLPAHLSKASFMPSSSPSSRCAPVSSSAPPAQDDGTLRDTPDGFPDNCSNFTFDYILYDSKNAPATSFVWDGFDALKSTLPDDIVASHTRVASFIAMSREKVNGLDQILNEFRSIRTGLNRNLALAISRQKVVEASPAWLNRSNPVESAADTTQKDEWSMLSKLLGNLTTSQVDVLQYLSGDALVNLRSAIAFISKDKPPQATPVAESSKSPSHTTTPPPKKSRVSFDDDEGDAYADIFSSGLFDEDMPPVSDSPIAEHTATTTHETASVSPVVPPASAVTVPPPESSSLSRGQLKKIKKKQKGGR